MATEYFVASIIIPTRVFLSPARSSSVVGLAAASTLGAGISAAEAELPGEDVSTFGVPDSAAASVLSVSEAPCASSSGLPSSVSSDAASPGLPFVVSSVVASVALPSVVSSVAASVALPSVVSPDAVSSVFSPVFSSEVSSVFSASCVWSDSPHPFNTRKPARRRTNILPAFFFIIKYRPFYSFIFPCTGMIL